jgi:hypothetical protein
MKPLKNYENLYYITDDLKIFSVARKGTSGNEIIPQMNIENGYLRVSLSKDNKRKKVMLHRIIAENFIPNPNNYNTVDHINGNKLDNRIENLRWCSQAENTRFDNHKIRRNNTSGFRGISFDKRCSKYQAEISFDGKRIYVGKFDTLEMAIQERNKHIMYHNG